MGWFVALIVLYIVIAAGEKLLGNPVAFLGLIFGGFCVALLFGVFQKAVGF